MKVAVFSTKPYDREYFDAENERTGHELTYLAAHLDADTAALASGHDAVCLFVNDQADAAALKGLSEAGVRVIALRSAGFNHVDLAAAGRLGLRVVRVPAYSPYAVAEHTVALLLSVNRKVHRAYNRVREGNFSLDGLMGFDLHEKTVGVIGTGTIGEVVARIFCGFGCRVIAFDVRKNPACEEMGVEYVELDEIWSRSDVLTLHCPLTPSTHHLVSDEAIARMKKGVVLLNTSRGALVDTRAVINGLKSGWIGAVGLDVYEEEAGLFFDDLSNQVLRDDVFARMLTFPNVVITGHQAYFTHEAMQRIAEVTVDNLADFQTTGRSANEVPVGEREIAH